MVTDRTGSVLCATSGLWEREELSHSSIVRALPEVFSFPTHFLTNRQLAQELQTGRRSKLEGQPRRTMRVRPMCSTSGVTFKFSFASEPFCSHVLILDRSALACHEGATNELIESGMTSRFSVMSWSLTGQL